MGASKRDISRVFNAETLIVGFAAGAIGIGVTLLLLKMCIRDRGYIPQSLDRIRIPEL